MGKSMTVILSMAVTLMLQVPSAAYADEASDILENVKDTYDDIDDAELIFSQKVSFQRTKLEQKASGKLLLRKRDQYRLEMDEQTVVTDGETVWSYSALTGQVIVDEFSMNDRTVSPEKVLTGGSDRYAATLVGREDIEENETVILKLVPRDDTSLITTLKLWVDEDSWLVRKAEVVEFSGKQTEYVIHEVRINTGLDESLFHYEVPDGVEVVDLR